MSEKQKEILNNICNLVNQIPETEQEKIACYAEGFAAGYKATSGESAQSDTTEDD